MFRRIPLSVFLFFALASSAQVTKLLPVRQGGKFGYINESGTVVVQPVYDAASFFFSPGYAVVARNGKYGIVDTSGNILVNEQYDYIESIKPGRFAARKGFYWGVIDAGNKVILPFDYDNISGGEKNTLLFCRDSLWGLADEKGKILFPAKYDTIVAFNEYYELHSGKLLGIADSNARILLEPKADSIRIERFKAEFIFVCYEGKNTTLFDPAAGNASFKWGNYSCDYPRKILFMKTDKKSAVYILSTHRLLSDSTMEECVALTGDLFAVKRKGRFGIMNSGTKMLLDCSYDSIFISPGKFFFVMNKGKYGTVSQAGKIICDASLDDIGDFNGSLADVTKNGKYGLLNISGALVVPAMYERIEVKRSHAKLYGKNNEMKLMQFDALGNPLQNEEYTNVHTITIGNNKTNSTSSSGNPGNWNYTVQDTSRLRCGWFFATKTHRYGLMDTATGKVIIPATFSGIDIMDSVGLTRVCISIKKGDHDELRFGLVDHRIKRVIAPVKYNEIHIEDLTVKGHEAMRAYDGKFCFITRGGQVLAPASAFIGDFHDGHAVINVGGRFAQICDSCRTLYDLDSKYELASGEWFGNPARRFIVGGKWGYVNRDGSFFVQPQFQFTKDFESNTAIVKSKGKWGVIDSLGTVIVNFDYNRISYLADGSGMHTKKFLLEKYLDRQGFVDHHCNYITELKYRSARNFHDGMAAVLLGDKWGFIDTTGREVTAFEYNKVDDFYNGFASVKQKGHWGFIDKAGYVVVSIDYMSVGRFSEGMASVMVSGKYGFVDSVGNLVIQPQFNKVSEFSDGLAIVSNSSGCGAIDMKGGWVVKPVYGSIGNFNAYDVAVAYKPGEGYGLLKHDGTELTAFKYQSIGEFSESMALIRENNLYGYIDNLGNVVVQPKFKAAQNFSEGFAAVRTDEGWRYINESGQFVNDKVYASAGPFHNGFAQTINNATDYFIGTGGEVIFSSKGGSIKYSDFSEDGFSRICYYKKGFTYIDTRGKQFVNAIYQDATPFYSGRAMVRYRYKWGVLDKGGFVIGGFHFDEASPFNDGISRVRIITFYGMADHQGKVVVPAEYESLKFNGHLFMMERKGSYGYLKLNGDWLWKPQ